MKLIKKTESQRYYQLDFDVKIFGSLKRPKKIKDLFLREKLKFTGGFELNEDVNESVNKICVSDAHSHIERLVFPAFSIINPSTGEIKTSHINHTICGKYTFKLYGGDSRDVYDDVVYERYLKILNRNQ